eukprot:SAG31_NODE_30183_length_384_cov_1.133333_1_plen_97_part_01
MDQSGHDNNLGQRHKLVNASLHPITVGKNQSVYGMWFVSAAPIVLSHATQIVHELVSSFHYCLQIFCGSTPDALILLQEPGYGYHVDKTTGIATGNE